MNSTPEKQPLVSVLMPAYNSAATLRLAFASLFLQTHKNWLCVVVNDGSTDGTRNFLQQYSQNPHFKIIHLDKNKGRGNARQVALDNAEGKYVAFLDADDFYHPAKIERQVSILEKNPNLALVSSGTGVVDQTKELRSVRSIGSGTPRTFHYGEPFPAITASCMLRTSEAKNVRFNTGLDVGEDLDYIYRYLDGKQFQMMPDMLYFYDEIGTVTFRKLMSYQFKNLKSVFVLLRKKPVTGLNKLALNIIKIVAYSLIVPILGVDRVVARRGRKPTPTETADYKRIWETLSITLYTK